MALPTEGCGIHWRVAEQGGAPLVCMSPLYDLILQRKDELQTETVQVADAAQAWRLGRERYPHCIRGVVRRDAGRDGSAAEPSKRR